MTIKARKEATEFYIDKSDYQYLRKALNFYKSLSVLKLVYDKYIIQSRLSKCMQNSITEKFKEYKNNEVIISGFQGCLITGYKFKWKN